MLRRRKRRDPFWDDGVAARERNHRYWIESVTAFSVSIVACGLASRCGSGRSSRLVDRLAFH